MAGGGGGFAPEMDGSPSFAPHGEGGLDMMPKDDLRDWEHLCKSGSEGNGSYRSSRSRLGYRYGTYTIAGRSTLGRSTIGRNGPALVPPLARGVTVKEVC